MRMQALMYLLQALSGHTLLQTLMPLLCRHLRFVLLGHSLLEAHLMTSLKTLLHVVRLLTNYALTRIINTLRDPLVLTLMWLMNVLLTNDACK